MKKSMMHLFLGSLLAVSVVGCGKDKGGSSSTPAPKPVNNTSTSKISSSVDQQGKTAFANFKKWYTSSTNGSYPGLGLYTETRTTYTFSSGSNCTAKPIKLFGVEIGTFQTCTNNGSPTGSNVETKQVAVLAGGKKSSNKILADIYGGKYGTMIGAVEAVSYNSPLYIMRFQKSDGSIREFWVDSGVNSAFQPVKIIDLTENSEEILTDIN